ncbi:polysaccharide biosynthesis tyrosine autokinase [Gemmata sp. JC717]|uniref:tyrosine-protein kinase domain-containing protein n=1 Tax=Gemmata algarum TaxID=2975278 RepID=UPI0021BB5B91|nr:polysaccharide biosynthesis tyrosine autokinase [Gemmata algarum]MDY3552100.1 polysaccharide biosynthesis tyrosine autokinase [Gemmata algarum]
MARPIAGDPPASPPPAPFPTPGGVPATVAPSPFSYTNQPSLPGPTVSSAPTPSGLWNAFRRRWVLSTFVGALVAAAVATGAWLAMPAGKHQARALVQLQPQHAYITNKGQEDFEWYRRRQIYLLTKDRDLFNRVLADPAVASLAMVKTADDPVAMLEDAVRVSVAAPEMLEVTLTGNHLDDMKVLLDKLIKRYLDDTNAFDNRSRAEDREHLRNRRSEVQNEIAQGERVIEFTARNLGVNGTGDANGSTQLLHIKFGELDRMFTAANHELGDLQSQLSVYQDQLEERKRDPKKFAADTQLLKLAVARDKRVVAANELWQAANDLYTKELKNSNPENAYIQELKAAADKYKKALDDVQNQVATEAETALRFSDLAERQKKVSDLADQIAIKGKVRDNLRIERDTAKKTIESTAGGGASIDAMRKNLEPQRALLSRLDEQLLQLSTGEGRTRASARGEAEKIPNNNQNKKLAMSSVGGLGAFLTVVLLISFLEWRTRRVDGVDQVVTELGMRVIGTVPVFPNRASLQAAVEAGGANWRFVLNESINSTRTMLLHTAKSQSMQVVMVTSATQGEGKTSISSQLATSMATAGMRTLIVDCDLRNPCVMKLFEIPLTPGVSEVLREEVDVSDAVQATAVPNLWVIPAGQCSNATIAALAQGHPLETLFNRLRGQFDFVIVDSCPVLPVADALLIAQHVDGVVFSIMQDISQLPKVMTASEKLTQLNIPLVGAVVNGIKQDVYSYGYNYVKQLPA